MSVCPRCQATFGCCMVEGTSEPCWCTRLPLLPAEALAAADREGQGGRCYCPACLRELVTFHAVPHLPARQHAGDS